MAKGECRVMMEITLTPNEIRTAITEYLIKRGYAINEGFVHLWQDPGDPPTSGPDIYARVKIGEDKRK